MSPALFIAAVVLGAASLCSAMLKEAKCDGVAAWAVAIGMAALLCAFAAGRLA